MDTPCCDFHLHPLLGADLCPIARTHHDSGRRRRFRALAVCPHVAAPRRAEHLVSFLIYAAIGYFLIELNNRFSIIRMRASVQTAIYFLLVTVCPEMHLLYAGNVAAITFLFSIYFLFKSYQQAQASGYLFYSFLFIGAGSILFPQLTFFSVLWVFEAHRFQSLTFRSFCGALVGWTMPYWMLFGHAFFYVR